MGVRDGTGVGEAELNSKVENVVKIAVVSMVGGAFCHRT